MTTIVIQAFLLAGGATVGESSRAVPPAEAIAAKPRQELAFRFPATRAVAPLFRLDGRRPTVAAPAAQPSARARAEEAQVRPACASRQVRPDPALDAAMVRAAPAGIDDDMVRWPACTSR